jgi:hypothetical protein
VGLEGLLRRHTRTTQARAATSAIQDLSNVAGEVRNNQTVASDGSNILIQASGHGADGDYAFEYRDDALGNQVFSGGSFVEEMDYGHHVGDSARPNRLIKRRASAVPAYDFDACGDLFLPKWSQIPITTTVRLVTVHVVLIAGGKVAFRRVMLFIEVGPGGGALTLGAVA